MLPGGPVAPSRPGDDLGAVLKVELVEDVLHVVFDCVIADVESFRRLFVGQTLGHQVQVIGVNYYCRCASIILAG